jgi:hypothetical protein
LLLLDGIPPGQGCLGVGFPHSPNDYGNNHGCNCQKDERLHFEGLPTFGEFPFFPAKSGLLAGAHYRAQAITTFTSI